jgi:hypothetical protein
MRVAADAVHDEEGHPVLVGDVLRLDHADGLLDLVALGEVGAEAPVHHLEVSRLDLAEIGVVARAADAPLHTSCFFPSTLPVANTKPRSS